jgi:Ca2+-binding RTX toxin-like protein
MFSRANKTVRSRRLSLESLEARQLMAADLMAMDSGETFARPAARDVATVQVAEPITGSFASAPVTSTSGTTAQFTGAASTLSDFTLVTNGVLEQVPITTPQPTVQLINGSLLIHGTPANDNVSVSFLSNQSQAGYLVQANGTTYWFDQSQVNGGDVSFYGFAGNDTFHNDASSQLRAIVFAGDGDDTITGGVKDDILDGGLGIDHIYGMAGKDYISVGDGPGWNYAEGGAGDDKIYGGNGMDFLNGNDGRDLIYGRLGEDYLEGGAGNDLLDGGTGDYSYNYLSGDSGNDELYGGWGFDYMVGNSGNDIIAGRAGDDYLNGGTGCDRLFGEAGDDTLEGGIDGNSDVMYGGTGRDTFTDEQYFDWLGREKHEHIMDYEPGVDFP